MSSHGAGCRRSGIERERRPGTAPGEYRRLHVFKESDGSELWAFIPPDLLGNLKTLTVTNGEHDYYVDASPVAADIKVGSTWKTILVFGLRRGGNSYHALDITDINNPTYLWSFTDTKIAETWSEPAIGKVKIGTADKYVMFVGGGFDSAVNNAHGKALFVVDLSNGSLLWQYYNDATADDRQYMNFSLPEKATAVDLDNNGYVDHVYVGDVGGQLWKFDVAATATTSWTGKRLFVAVPTQANPPAAGEFYPAQAFFGAPSLALAPDRSLWVFIGTGDRYHPNSSALNRFYGIKDDTTMGNGSVLTESNLADVTTTNGTAANGWFVKLGNASEKVLAAPNVFNSQVIFASFTPTTTVSCTSGSGTARLYDVQMLTGYAAVDFSTGHTLTTTGASSARSTVIGQGIPSMPIIVITPPGTPGAAAASSVIVSTTNQQLPNNAIPAPAFLKQVRSWLERVQ